LRNRPLSATSWTAKYTWIPSEPGTASPTQAGAGDHRDLGEAPRLHVLEDLAASHAVGMRRLEDEQLHRVDDLDRPRQGYERNFRRLDDRDDRHGGAGRRAADDGDDAIILDQARGEGPRLVGVAAVVIEEELDLLAEHAAGGVDLVDRHVDRLHRELAQRPEEAGARRQVTDADHVRLPIADVGKAGNADRGSGAGAFDECATRRVVVLGHVSSSGSLISHGDCNMQLGWCKL